MSLYNTGNYIQYPVISHNRKEYFKKECELSLVLCDGLEGRDGREVQEGGAICKRMADSLGCRAESNATLQNNYTPILNKECLYVHVSLCCKANVHNTVNQL